MRRYSNYIFNIAAKCVDISGYLFYVKKIIIFVSLKNIIILFDMQATFKQYSPQELYVPVSKPDSLEAENEFDLPVSGFRPTGCVFFDTFMTNLSHYGIRNARFHANLLGINYAEMCIAISVLTGMTYTDFTEGYVIVKAEDLIRNKSGKTTMQDIAASVGFSYSGFYHFMIRKGAWEKKRY